MTNQLREQQYTPTTNEVRNNFISSPGNRDWEVARLLAFDRWLSAAITEAKAEGKREGWDEGVIDGIWNHEHEGMIHRGIREEIVNPYRTPKETP